MIEWLRYLFYRMRYWHPRLLLWRHRRPPLHYFNEELGERYVVCIQTEPDPALFNGTGGFLSVEVMQHYQRCTRCQRLASEFVSRTVHHQGNE